MKHSVQIDTPIPSAEKIAERLGIGVRRQRELLVIVRHRAANATVAFHKSSPVNRPDKRAKTAR